MKKNLLLVLIIMIIAMAITLVGCNAGDIKTSPTKTPAVFTYDINTVADFSIPVVLGETTYTFDRSKLASYDLKDITTSTIKTIDGVETTVVDNWKGVALSDIVTAAEFTGTITNIKSTATDHFAITDVITAGDISNYYIVIFQKVDDAFSPLAVDKIRKICSTDQFQSNWVKKLKRVELNYVAPNTFSIVINSGEDSVTIDNSKLNYFDLYNVTTNTTSVEDWKGFKLADLLAYAEITDTVTSIDFIVGETVKSYETVADINTFYIFLYKKADGVYSPLASGDIRNGCSTDTAKSLWVKGLTTIEINPVA